MRAGHRARGEAATIPGRGRAALGSACNRGLSGGFSCSRDGSRPSTQIARERGTIPVVYWIVRAILQPFFHAYFRLRRIGIDHIPAEGPVLLAANHRSFSDPFLIGTCLRRPLHFVAKVELFEKRWQAWILLALGAFPIRRGESDEQAMETARIILERGGAVGHLPRGHPRAPRAARPSRARGVGRLALETGAPVVPVAITGTEDIRRGWRIRPRRVTVRCGQRDDLPAAARRHAQRGAGPRGHAARVVVRLLAVGVARRHAAACATPSWSAPAAGAPPSRCCWRAAARRSSSRAGRPSRRPSCAPARTNVALPARRRAAGGRRADDRGRGRPLTAPTSSAWPSPRSALPRRARLRSGDRLPRGPRRPGAEQGPASGPTATLPESSFVRSAPGRGRSHASAAPGTRWRPSQRGAALVVGSQDRDFRGAARERASRAAASTATISADLVGVELAGVAKNAAALAAAAALPGGANAAGAAAGPHLRRVPRARAARAARSARDLHRPGRHGRPRRDRAGRAPAATGAPARCWRGGVSPDEIQSGSARCPRRSGWCPRWPARWTRRASGRRPRTELAALVEGRMSRRALDRAGRPARRRARGPPERPRR